MNKQCKIQEIEKILNECCNTYDEKGNRIGNKCSHCECWDDTNNLCCSYNNKEAEALYNAGYRKIKQGKWIYDFGWIGVIRNYKRRSNKVY